MSLTMRVAIDARLLSGTSGGVQQVILGLAEGFRSAAIPDLERVWFVYRGHGNWLRPHLPAGDVVVEVGSTLERSALAFAHRAPRVSSRLRPYYERLAGSAREAGEGPFDDQLRRQGIDVVHLPFQDGFRTTIPSIYQPHDLQHLHFPEFFSQAQIDFRETVWRARAHQAAMVVVGTSWVAEDIGALWAIPPERITVIPLAPPGEASRRPPVERARPVGSHPFVLYPAAFWPHKNHSALVRSIATLRQRGIGLRVVLPGAKLGEAPKIAALARELGVSDLVEFPGYVSNDRLAELFRCAAMVCVPTLFESASFPVWEAFSFGTPVAASRVTALPGQVGDAGLLFDPLDPDAIADCLDRLLHDEALRDELVRRGGERLRRLGWDRTALAFTAVYRTIAGVPLHERESAALALGAEI